PLLHSPPSLQEGGAVGLDVDGEQRRGRSRPAHGPSAPSASDPAGARKRQKRRSSPLASRCARGPAAPSIGRSSRSVVRTPSVTSAPPGPTPLTRNQCLRSPAISALGRSAQGK